MAHGSFDVQPSTPGVELLRKARLSWQVPDALATGLPVLESTRF